MKKTDINQVHEILKTEYKKLNTPIVELIEAQTKDPFKVLVATILSARTKDQTTAAACKRLFKIVNDPADLTKLSIGEIEGIIMPVGFYRNKARFLKKLPEELKKRFKGKVPKTLEELVSLPGVGRKTANIVLAVAFGIPAIGVDVHVHRISNRLGFIRTKTPFESEMALTKKLPRTFWSTYNTYLVAFGQSICTPINPFCSKCAVYDYCQRLGVAKSR